MRKNKFVHYEISNFCHEGFLAKHNSSYWKGEHYLGLGPSAHSFNGVSRQWNVSNNAEYVRAINENKIFFEEEMLTDDQRYNEYILTSLRTMWGVDIVQVEKVFGKERVAYCLAEALPYIDAGALLKKENKLLLTDKGKFIADKITSDLFIAS